MATADWFVSPGSASLNNMPGIIDLRLYRGDSANCPFSFVTQFDNEPYVLSGTWRAQIRSAPEDPDALDEFAVDDSQQATGLIVLTLTPDQTLELPDRSVWDLENVSEDATIGTHTWLMGSLYIGGQITR